MESRTTASSPRLQTQAQDPEDTAHAADAKDPEQRV